VHGNQVAALGTDGDEVLEPNDAGVLGIDTRLLADSRRRTTDVKGTHGELRAGLADGLRGDDAGGFAEFDQAAGSEVASVAQGADTALGFAGEHRANLDALHAGGLNLNGQLFRDFLVEIDDDVAFVVLDLLQRNAADDAIAHVLDDVASFHDGSDVDAVD